MTNCARAEGHHFRAARIHSNVASVGTAQAII